MTPSPASGRHGRPARGFTLLELLIVVAIVALSSAVAALALPDGNTTRLDREAQRLVTLFESARAHARSFGIEVIWRPGTLAREGESPSDFRFEGLPADIGMPQRWLQADPGQPLGVAMSRNGQPSAAIVLGPEPYIGPQRVILQLGDRSTVLATDGLGPFTVQGSQ